MLNMVVVEVEVEDPPLQQVVLCMAEEAAAT